MENKEFIGSDELIAILEARCFAYNILKQCFITEPTPEIIQSMIEMKMTSIFPFLEEDLIKQGIEKIDHCFNSPSNIYQFFDEIQSDYTRLFLGPGKLLAPPWESPYCNKERLLYQQEMLEVCRAYSQYGLASTLPNEPADHIALELDYMYQTSLLCIEKSSGTAALSKILKDQLAFLNEHLLVWTPKFADDVKENAMTTFYQGISLMLKGFLYVDKEVIGKILLKII